MQPTVSNKSLTLCMFTSRAQSCTLAKCSKHTPNFTFNYISIFLSNTCSTPSTLSWDIHTKLMIKNMLLIVIWILPYLKLYLFPDITFSVPRHCLLSSQLNIYMRRITVTNGNALLHKIRGDAPERRSAPASQPQDIRRDKSRHHPPISGVPRSLTPTNLFFFFPSMVCQPFL